MTTNSTRTALAISLQEYIDSLEQAKFLSVSSFAEEYLTAAAEAAAAATPLYVAYFWSTDELKEIIYMLTTYKGKNVKTNEKEPKDRLDELTITEDETLILDRLLKLAAKDVYGIIASYGKNITGGYLYSPAGTLPVAYNIATVYNEGDLFYVGTQLYYTIADSTPAGTSPTDEDWFDAVGEFYNTYHKIIYKVNYSDNMDPSKITVLNDDLEDAIVKHVLLAWYKVLGERDMIPIAEQEYDDAVYKVRNSLMFTKTPIRRRTEML